MDDFILVAIIMTESVRLAKRLAEILPCSRRQAELYIEGGWVSVDGQVVEVVGYRVTAEQQVSLAAEANIDELVPVTIVLHQPAGVDAGEGEHAHAGFLRQWISSEQQSDSDKSGLVLLQRHLRDLRMLLPLKLDASGMTVLSQDWRVVRKLTEDAAKVEQEYVVEVTGELIPDGLALLNHGLTWNGRPLAPIKVSWQNETRLRFALKGVQPGQIRGMCAQVGLKPVTLRRIRIGRVAMAGLQPGAWRYLLPNELF